MSLPSWRETATRAAVVGYLRRITEPDGLDFVPVVDRIAVFDNDGTLWCERPGYPQAAFLIHELGTRSAADPALAERPVVRALLADGLAAARGFPMDEILRVLIDLHAGVSPEAFAEAVTDWAAGYRDERFGTPLAGLVYAPMLELLALLREHGFRVFIVTGGGVDFVRALSTELYGVTPDDVVGSAVVVEMARDEGNGVVLVRQGRIRGPANEGAPKVVNIHAQLGVRPIVAVGNSAGDREMLEYTHGSSHPSLCVVLDHDDAEREYAYASASFTDPGAESLLDVAARSDWVVVSMRDDWSRVFG